MTLHITPRCPNIKISMESLLCFVLFCFTCIMSLFKQVNNIFSSILFNDKPKSKKLNRKRVLMTGFGPFASYNSNPSWEGVEKLNEKAVENKYDIILIKKEIPVRYADVDQKVPKWLDRVRPDLTIHVGVNELAPCFLLETQAKRSGYIEDYSDDKNYPANGEHVYRGPNSIVTQLDVAAISRKFNHNREDELHVKISSDPGLFLCEYIYYTSLYLGQNSTLFVHVPDKKYTPEQLAHGLDCILGLCLEELDKH